MGKGALGFGVNLNSMDARDELEVWTPHPPPLRYVPFCQGQDRAQAILHLCQTLAAGIPLARGSEGSPGAEGKAIRLGMGASVSNKKRTECR